MRYSLRKAPGRNLYWVVDQSGKHHSVEPLPKTRAEAQMRALYASQRGGAIMNRVRALESARAQLATLKNRWAEMAYTLPKPLIVDGNQQRYGLILDQGQFEILQQIGDLTQRIHQMEEEAYSALGEEFHGQ